MSSTFQPCQGCKHTALWPNVRPCNDHNLLAGNQYIGDTVNSDLRQMMLTFDTNFWGSIRGLQAVLPLMPTSGVVPLPLPLIALASCCTMLLQALQHGLCSRRHAPNSPLQHRFELDPSRSYIQPWTAAGNEKAYGPFACSLQPASHQTNR